MTGFRRDPKGSHVDILIMHLIGQVILNTQEPQHEKKHVRYETKSTERLTTFKKTSIIFMKGGMQALKLRVRVARLLSQEVNHSRVFTFKNLHL